MSPKRSQALDHVVLVLFENRSLDNLLSGTLVGCGSGDTAETGEMVDDGEIEPRITAAMESEFGREVKVNCPDGGIEAGTDFTCIATAVGLDESYARSRIETHLDSDGETIEPFDPEPIRPDSGPAGAFPP